jgi:hypothetical protein
MLYRSDRPQQALLNEAFQLSNLTTQEELINLAHIFQIAFLLRYEL